MFVQYLRLPFESYVSSLLYSCCAVVRPTVVLDDVGERKTPRVAIIGAGVSGIAAAAHITELGYDVHIFEAGGEEVIGGIWTQVNATSGLQISSQFYQPHPSVRWSCEYPTAVEIIQQLRELWRRFGLHQKTTFHCPVSTLKKAGNRWLINDGREGLFDGVIPAVGTCGPARSCQMPGQDRFGGDLVQSTQLSSVEMSGKNVAVVGGGASAVEALEYAVDHGAAKVTVLARSEKWIIPRWRPLNFVLAASLSGPFTLWASVVGEVLRWFFYGSDCGHVAPTRSSKQHVYSSTPIVNSRALDLIRGGRADWLKGDCQHFEKDGIVFKRHDHARQHPSCEPRSVEPCDVCIQATGFQRPTLRFLEPYQGNYEPPNWYMQVFPPGEPTICALNSTWQEAFGSVGGSQIGLFTRMLLVFLIDPTTQPTRLAMEDWVDIMLRWNRGLRFITHIEVYLWLFVAIACDWRLWPWGRFIITGGAMPSSKRSSRS